MTSAPIARAALRAEVLDRSDDESHRKSGRVSRSRSACALVALSLPVSTHEDNVDRRRGAGVLDKSIRGICRTLERARLRCSPAPELVLDLRLQEPARAVVAAATEPGSRPTTSGCSGRTSAFASTACSTITNQPISRFGQRADQQRAVSRLHGAVAQRASRRQPRRRDVPQPGVGRLARLSLRLRLQPDARDTAARAGPPRQPRSIWPTLLLTDLPDNPIAIAGRRSCMHRRGKLVRPAAARSTAGECTRLTLASPADVRPASGSHSPLSSLRALPSCAPKCCTSSARCTAMRSALAEIERVGECEAAHTQLVFKRRHTLVRRGRRYHSCTSTTQLRSKHRCGATSETELGRRRSRQRLRLRVSRGGARRGRRTLERDTRGRLARGRAPRRRRPPLDVRARLAALPMHLVAAVGDSRIGIVHGDGWALAGWRFAHDSLHNAERASAMNAAVRTGGARRICLDTYVPAGA